MKHTQTDKYIYQRNAEWLFFFFLFFLPGGMGTRRRIRRRSKWQRKSREKAERRGHVESLPSQMILLLSIVVLLVVGVQFAPLPFLSPLRVQQSLHRSRRERSALIVSHSQKKKMLFKVLFVVCLLFVHSTQGK